MNNQTGPLSHNRATIRDVAIESGLSKSLVSRAFVNPERVGSESLETIMRAAEKLDFQPSWSARTLNAHTGGFTGIVIADLYSPAFAPIVAGAYRTLVEAGHEVLLAVASLSPPAGHRSLEDPTIAFLGGLRPESLIIVGSVPDMSSLEPIAKQVPTVVAGARDVSISTNAEIFSDDVSGFEQSIGHLAGLGHKRIAHISGSGKIGSARARAYEKAMAKYGLQEYTRVVQGDFEEPTGYKTAMSLLSCADRPTAITAASDHSALGALGAIRKLGALEVSVVGYGDAPAASFHLADLTTVRANNEAIGNLAAEGLIESRGDASVAMTPVQVRVSPSLILRTTTGPVAQ